MSAHRNKASLVSHAKLGIGTPGGFSCIEFENWPTQRHPDSPPAVFLHVANVASIAVQKHLDGSYFPNRESEVACIASSSVRAAARELRVAKWNAQRRVHLEDN